MGKASQEDRGEADPADDARMEFAPPLRPRPRLVMGLGIVLGLWVAFLLALYFRTVYPERRTTDPRPASPLTSETSKR